MNEARMIKTFAWREGEFYTEGKIGGEGASQKVKGQISPCGQFGLDYRDEVEKRWIITHLATGLKLPPMSPRPMSEAQAKEFVAAIAPLADWNQISVYSPETAVLGPQVKTIYQTLNPETSTKENK